MDTPESPPIRKSEYPFRASGTKVTTASTPAPNIPDRATPASTRVSRDAPVRSATVSTRTAPKNAPARAAKGTAATAPGFMAQQMAAASPAPELTPMVLGAARGFASTPWIMAPAHARAAPARSPAQVRGRRTYARIRVSTVS